MTSYSAICCRIFRATLRVTTERAPSGRFRDVLENSTRRNLRYRTRSIAFPLTAAVRRMCEYVQYSGGIGRDGLYSRVTKAGNDLISLQNSLCSRVKGIPKVGKVMRTAGRRSRSTTEVPSIANREKAPDDLRSCIIDSQQQITFKNNGCRPIISSLPTRSRSIPQLGQLWRSPFQVQETPNGYGRLYYAHS